MPQWTGYQDFVIFWCLEWLLFPYSCLCKSLSVTVSNVHNFAVLTDICHFSSANDWFWNIETNWCTLFLFKIVALFRHSVVFRGSKIIFVTPFNFWDDFKFNCDWTVCEMYSKLLILLSWKRSSLSWLKCFCATVKIGEQLLYLIYDLILYFVIFIWQMVVCFGETKQSLCSDVFFSRCGWLLK